MKWIPLVFLLAVMPLIYLVVLTVIGLVSSPVVFSQDLVAMVVTAVVSGTLGAATGYSIGSSNGSAKKDEKVNGVNG